MYRYFEINQGGHNIRCKIYCEDEGNIRRAVIFGHGFGGHKDNGAAEKFAERLLSLHKDAAVITFNWPCHGDDEKETLRLEDCGSYVRQVIDYAKDTLGAEELYAYATSFGGYLMLKYISDHGNPFGKIALRCPAVNMYEVLTEAIMSERDFERLKREREALVGFDRKIPVDAAFLQELQENDIRKRDYGRYRADILSLHGTEDEIVAFGEGCAFAESNQITFVPVAGADHRFQAADTMDKAIAYIMNFFSL